MAVPMASSATGVTFGSFNSLVSRGRRGILWRSNMCHNVSKFVLCGRRNNCATVWHDELHFSWQVQHFGELHVISRGRCNTLDVPCCAFLCWMVSLPSIVCPPSGDLLSPCFPLYLFLFPFFRWRIHLPEGLVSLCLPLHPFLLPFVVWCLRLPEVLSPFVSLCLTACLPSCLPACLSSCFPLWRVVSFCIVPQAV